MRVALVVHGRFHAFELAAALARRGHTLRVFTNYPFRAVEPYGLERVQVQSLVAHGIMSRAAWRIRERMPRAYPEAALHRWFGRWAAGALGAEPWDIIHPWSGVAEESLSRRIPHAHYLLMRGSAHIRTQADLLREEEERTGAPQEKPSAWMIAREEREYALADEVVTLSTFARNTFIQQGWAPKRVRKLPLAAGVSEFRPTREIVEARAARLLGGAPLRILFVGARSYRKGLYDLAEVARALPQERFWFRCVGAETAETRELVRTLAARVEFVPNQPQSELAAQYAQADVFILPTIEDGFALTMAQARASCLPIVATVNSGAPDIIVPGQTGWLVPIRSPEELSERLRYCDTHRAELAAMVERAWTDMPARTWDDVASEFELICQDRQGGAAPQ